MSELFDVGVAPGAELRARPRLFGALAGVLPVRFRAVDGAHEAGEAPLIVFAAGDGVEARGRCLVFAGGTVGPPCDQLVRLGESGRLDARLRGRSLRDTAAGEGRLEPDAGDEVLASVDGRPVWLQRTAEGRIVDVALHAPTELAENEVLRDRLDPGNAVGLLPLVHFLREVCASAGWRTPPTRAAFVVDDPNLHRPSYGHLRYSDLVEHSRRHGHHTAIATVPLDGWYAHRGTVRLFHEQPEALSLCVHGNDHRLHELGRPSTLDEARGILRQALRRTVAFEARTGLPVSRVMVPPYEACSPASMQAIAEVGFEAVSTTRPAPWLPLGPPNSPYVTEGSSATAGWSMAELTAGGLPVLIRRRFDELDEIVLRSYLDQPVILYGHVADLAGGLEPLAAAAAVINSLPSVEWRSLGEIAAGNFEWRRVGDELEVRPFARRIRIQVDPDVTELRVRMPPAGRFEALRTSAGRVSEEGSVVELPRERDAPVDVDLAWGDLPHGGAPEPRLSPAVVGRRLLVETRDRLGPMLRGGAARAAG
jgi:hypothetical protein